MENYIVKNDKYRDGDDILFFDGEEVCFIDDNKDMYDILVMAGLFKSKNQAKNNWTRTGKEIPKGFNDYMNIGKLNKRLTVFNPCQ